MYILLVCVFPGNCHPSQQHDVYQLDFPFKFRMILDIFNMVIRVYTVHSHTSHLHSFQTMRKRLTLCHLSLLKITQATPDYFQQQLSKNSIYARAKKTSFKWDFHQTHAHASPRLELAASADTITPGPVPSVSLIIQNGHKINQNYTPLFIVPNTDHHSSAIGVYFKESLTIRWMSMFGETDRGHGTAARGISVRAFTRAIAGSSWHAFPKVVLHLDTH